MSKQTPATEPNYSLLPTGIEGIDSLAEIALDLNWSWNHCTDEVWRLLDPTAGRQMVGWQHSLELESGALHFGETKIETRGEQHLFEVKVCLNGLDPEAVRVELYTDGANGGAPIQQEMQRVDQLGAATGCHVYSTAVSRCRPPADYTSRAIPYCAGVAVPLEERRILWQH